MTRGSRPPQDEALYHALDHASDAGNQGFAAQEPSFDSQNPTSAYRIMLPHMLPGTPNHRQLSCPAAPVRASKGACEGE